MEKKMWMCRCTLLYGSNTYAILVVSYCSSVICPTPMNINSKIDVFEMGLAKTSIKKKRRCNFKIVLSFMPLWVFMCD